MDSSDPIARRTVTAFFDSRAAAQQAVDDLAAAGVARDSISLVEGGPEPVETHPEPSRDKGFWASLRDLFMPEEDRHSYGEGLRRGGFLLAVRGDAATHDAAVRILDREGAVDMSEREAAWELEGWDPGRAGADLAARRTAARQPGAAPERRLTGADDAAWIGETRPAAPAPAAPAPATQLGATVPKEDLLEAYRGAADVPAGIEADPIPADEEAPGRTGQRDPTLGRARVRSYLDEG